MRLLETIALVAVGLLLVTAVARDVVRQLGIDARKVVDIRTFRHNFPATPKKHVEVSPGVRGLPDVTCGRPVPRAPVRVCLIMQGAAHVRYRTVTGTFMLPFLHSDRRRYRYSCTGYAVTHRLCSPGGGTPVAR